MSVTISTVNIGSRANDGTGDDIRTAFDKVNDSLQNLKLGVDGISLNQANTTLAKVANLQVTNRVIGNVFLYGADTIYINGTPVTTAGNAFTGGNVSGVASFLNSTGATSSTTGAVTITGGLGVGQNIYAGGIGVYTGNLVAASITDSSSATTGSLVTKGGLGVEKSARIGQTLTVTGTTTLSSTLGVTGVASLNATTESTNTTTGALLVAGGVGIVGNLNAGGTNHTMSGNLTVSGNLAVNGNLSFGTQTLRISDNIVDLHTNADLSPLTFDDGKDVGFKFHLYKSGYADYHAFAGWANDSTSFEFYDRGVEIGGNFVGNTYGVFKGGEFLSVNTTSATSTTTGAIRTSGGIGAAGNIYAGGAVVVTGNVSTGNVSATKGTFTSIAGTLLTAAQTNVTSVGTLTGLTVAGTTALQDTTAGTLNVTSGNVGILAVTTGLSTANAVITGGSLNNTTVGATTHSTGRFTTITATTVNAGTIGNASATLTGTLSTAAQPNITSLGTLSSVTVSGTGTLGNIVTTAGVFWSNGTAFASSLYSNANVTSYLPTHSGNITGNLLGSQPYITNLTGLDSLSLSGNVTAFRVIVSDAGGVFWSNGATALGGSGGGYGNIQVAQYLPIYNGNIDATITDSVQPYITQVGTLNSLVADTAVATNFSSGNIRISGGYISALTNATITTASITTVAATTLNASTATAATLNSTAANITTLAASNVSTANAVITGGSLNNATVGATTHNTGRFTTVTATTINAGTIGNTGTTLNGTLSANTQTSITSVGTLTGLTVSGNASVGNLTVTGTTTTVNSSVLDVTDINITVAKGATAAAANGGGITVDGAEATLTWNNSAAAWASNKNFIPGTNNALTIGGTSNYWSAAYAVDYYGTLRSGSQTFITSVGTLTGLTLSGAIVPSGNGTVNLGSTSAYWSNLYARNGFFDDIAVGGGSASFSSDILVTDTTAVANATKNISVSNGTRNISIIANISGGSYNSLSATGDSAIIASGSSIGNSSLTLTTWTSAASGIRIATASNVTTITLAGTTSSTGSIIPSANLTYDLGSTTAWWNNLYGKAIQAQYADLAEKYVADASYKPGTVVVFGGSAEVTLTTEFADVSVAGVVSTHPAYLMNSELDGIAIALRGRVPVDVVGIVKKGDLLVTSDCPGYAASIGKNANYGSAVFAKALQDKDDLGAGTIEAVII